MIEKVIDRFGSASKLAKALGVHRSAISQWADCGYLPPYRAVQVERLTNGEFKAVDLVEDKEGLNND